MKLAIMQPYFLPYIGYFSLFHNSDEFIFFDTPQYTKKSWYERNRIIKIQGGSTYIKVPIKKIKIGTPINEVEIDNEKDWTKKLFSQLDIYKKAPYYKDVIEVLNRAMRKNHDQLYRLNIDLIKEILIYLNIDKKIHIYSEMEIDIGEVKAPDEWALNISKKVGAKEYINSPGGKAFFDENKYINEGIELKFLVQPMDEYNQLTSEFEPGLSIVDVLMHNSKNDILKMMNKSSFL